MIARVLSGRHGVPDRGARSAESRQAGFEYYGNVRIPADEPPPPEELEREMENFVEPEEAFTRDEIE